MKVDTLVGTHIRDVCADAVAQATRSGEVVEFEFNGESMSISPGTSLEDAYKQWERKTGLPVLAPEAEAQKNRDALDKMRRDHAEAIANASVMTEQQLRDSSDPWPRTEDELLAQVRALVDRPHDYGTCCYAMSLAAVAAFNYVANRLGTTGFQAGAAQLDFIRRSRSHKFGTVIQDLGDILFPQYCDEQRFPHWDELLDREPNLAARIVAEARRKLSSDAEHAHPAVIAHWLYITKRWGEKSETQGAPDAAVV